MGKLNPRRLEWREEAWRLTMESLITTAPGVFVPYQQEVAGAGAIVATLGQLGEAERLGRAARQLFEQFQPTPGGTAAFEPRDGVWLPVDPASGGVSASAHAAVARPEHLAELERRVWMLEKRFARVDQLERRVAQLLERGQGLAQSPAGASKPSAAGPPARDAAAPAVAPGPAPPKLREEGTPPSPSTAAPDEPPAGSVAERPADDGGAAEAPSPSPPLLQPPPVGETQAILQMLLGDDTLRLRLDKAPISLAPEATEGWVVSWLLDDTDVVVGAITADIVATVTLGGLLLMVPESARKEHIEAGAPSEDEVEAVSEVFNNVTSALNGVEGNPHVRSSHSEPLRIDDAPWLREAVGVTLEVASGGKMCIFGRRAASI